MSEIRKSRCDWLFGALLDAEGEGMTRRDAYQLFGLTSSGYAGEIFEELIVAGYATKVMGKNARGQNTWRYYATEYARQVYLEGV